jgi:hypothetical protein
MRHLLPPAPLRLEGIAPLFSEAHGFFKCRVILENTNDSLSPRNVILADFGSELRHLRFQSSDAGFEFGDGCHGCSPFHLDSIQPDAKTKPAGSSGLSAGGVIALLARARR